MGYPFNIAYKGDEFARVNHDGSWSVNWPKTLNYSFEPVSPRNAAVIAAAVALIGAKDNFFLTPWKDSDDSKDVWQHQCRTLDIEEDEPEPGSIRSVVGISSSNAQAARVNYDGSWSINWPTVIDLAREPFSNYKQLAVLAFCKMLAAGQDRFRTAPWELPKADDDE